VNLRAAKNINDGVGNAWPRWRVRCEHARQELIHVQPHFGVACFLSKKESTTPLILHVLENKSCSSEPEKALSQQVSRLP
jgi:hypothetical protein